MTVAVVGVGNPTMGDDGLGRALVDRIDTEPAPIGRAQFAGTTAMLALEAIDGADRAVVADAVDAPGDPGTIHRFEPGGEGFGEVTMHDFTVTEAIRGCRGVYDLPSQIVVVGAVPATVEPRIGLSTALRRALPAVAAVVRAEAARKRSKLGNHAMDATWYCEDCETEIDPDAVDEHEQQGHSVRGRLRPERLLSQRPSQSHDSTDGGED
ncbi:hydrogenase maturation protease [Halovenus sp. WSH3]|uniref:Hydrogenase maturation protease n=1 Tax=Halovenus carboxidivorans TaxID=2692199 RepID=A0A6B0T307_9EURY|nr:hydrogenase maturation protease [Halovenus carboxidivorans]MXR52668.1 hydrogenase maturation protease [Halovenus carboxidivorans]